MKKNKKYIKLISGPNVSSISATPSGMMIF